MNSNFSLVSRSFDIFLLSFFFKASILFLRALFVVFNQSDGLRPANWFLFMEEPAKKSMVARNASSLSWVVIVPVLSFSVNSFMKSG